jgi:hypothetical protein
MRGRIACLVFVLLFMSAGCSTIQVKYDYDKEFSFAELRSYSWLPQPENVTAAPTSAVADSQLMEKRIKGMTDNELSRKGYKLTTETPDFFLVYHLGVEQKIDVTSYGYSYARPYRYRGMYGEQVVIHPYTQGTLIIDVIAPQTKELIWRGIAEGTVEKEASVSTIDKKISAAVTKIFSEFPPKKVN